MKSANVFNMFVLTVMLLAGFSAMTLSAGELNPPAAPTAGTMKTLDQIQPRTPIRQANIPLTISVSGSYYLTENITSTSSQGAINITADNVTLDLSGFSITGSGTFANYGVLISGRTNVQVKNGTLTGFVYGVADTSGSTANNHRIVNVRMVANRRGGVFLNGHSHTVIDCVAADNGCDASGGWGISVATNAVIRNCTVSGNGIGISGYSASGITTGEGCIIEANTVYNNGCDSECTVNGGILAGDGSIVKDNIVYGNASNTTGSGKSYGIYAYGGCVISGNTIYKNGTKCANVAFYGIYGYLGCTVKDNTVFGNALDAVCNCYGIYSHSGCTVKGNTAYDNAVDAAGTCYGIYVHNNSTVDQNAAYGNTGTNLYIGATCATGVNGTL